MEVGEEMVAVKTESESGVSLHIDRCLHEQTISFSNLTFHVNKKNQKEPLRILNGVSGVFRAARLTAVMGGSGAGKTTLLSAIGGFIDNVAGGALSGQIMMNGKNVSGDDIRHVSAFVFQDDTIMDTMTVFEAILISATLRLPQSMSYEEQVQKVNAVIDSLGLTHVKNSTVGSNLSRGISGGEKKRVAIAVEMVCNPDILFLDEPTSGLDAFMSLNVIKKLKALAKTGRTIVCTIHQPSSEIFSEFDDLVLMAKGKVIYMGEVGENGKNVVDYFGTQGFHCPPYSNPADYIFMHILNVTADQSSKSAEIEAARDENVARLLTAWEQVSKDAVTSALQASKISQDLCAAAVAASPDKDSLIVASNEKKAGSSTLKQTILLSKRALNNFIRNPALFKARLGTGIILALIMGLLYLRLDKDQTSINSRIGAQFFIAINNLFGAVMPTLSVFALEKVVFRREYGTGMYTLPSYFLSKIVVESLLSVFVSIIASTIVYFLIGYQETGTKWFIYTAANAVETLVGNVAGLAFGAMFDDAQKALAVVPLLILPMMLFSGYFQNNARIGWWFRWYQYVSPIKYAFEIMAINEFRGLDLNCKPEQFFNDPITGDRYCQYTRGEQVLDLFGIDELSIGETFGCLFSLLFLFMILAYLNLYLAVNAKK